MATQIVMDHTGDSRHLFEKHDPTALARLSSASGA